MTPAEKETILYNFYAAERRAGACPIEANERMMEFSKRFDDVELERYNTRERKS
jgi:hypothetical protein